jgi:hypothetical protein
MLAADCLVLGNTTTGNNCESILPSKIFEYLAAARPILHVGPAGGSCDALIQKCQAGVTVEPDPQRVGDALLDIWSRWSCGNPLTGCAPERFAPYTRQALTSELAAILDRLAGASATQASAGVIKEDRERSDIITCGAPALSPARGH